MHYLDYVESSPFIDKKSIGTWLSAVHARAPYKPNSHIKTNRQRSSSIGNWSSKKTKERNLNVT